MDINLLRDLISIDYENEWLEFKQNWIDRNELGQYISAISNSATEHGQENGYFIWGVDDKTHKIVGTTFNPDMEIQNEPLKHFLARKLSPSINFKFENFSLDEKNIVVLTIPQAQRIITEFDKERFIRIGSSKELLRKYPEKEADLWVTLKNGIPSIINTPSPRQNLEFSQLLTYYFSKGLPLKETTFAEDLHFYIPGTCKYNELAYILSDNNDTTCRISIFSGKRKSDTQYSLTDYGRKSVLLTIDSIINEISSFNTVIVDETSRIFERKDTALFDFTCFREALLNAFIHNDWVDLNAPMITIFTNRMEILSYGSLPAKQTLSGFYAGKSKPRCQELAEVFLQLRLSERSGRGVIRILDKYGKKAFEIKEDYIKITIPFSYERQFGNKLNSDKKNNVSLNKSEKNKEKIFMEIKNNPDITTTQLMEIVKLGKTSVQKYIKELTNEKRIYRKGSRKTGQWSSLNKTRG